jgi:hypothetical protein
MTGILGVIAGGAYFQPVTRTYTSGFTDTIPAGATTAVWEVWGEGAGGGGDNNTSGTAHGGGGGSGGYSRTSVSVAGHVGQTFSGTLQAGGTAGAVGNSGLPNAGSQPAATVAVGTFSGSFTTMSALAGSGGINGIGSASPGAGGQGGTASGGTQANTTGNNGTAGTTSSGGGGAGGPGIAGVNGTGNAGGTGGSNLALATAGGSAKAIVRYT